MARYTHPNVLVVNEVGYLTYGSAAANMLFHEDLAQAIVDRVLERGRLLPLDGPPFVPGTWALTWCLCGPG